MTAKPWDVRYLEPLNEDVAAATAQIIGDGSACKRALAELAKRRKAGESVCLYRDVITGVIIVGPTLDAQEE